MADESTTETTSEETSTEESTTSSEESNAEESTDETKVTPEDDWQAKARKHEDSVKALRKQLKDLKPLADKAKELEESQKSESEKLTDRLTTTEKELAEAKADATRLRVAIKYDLSEDDLDFLGSGDEEQIEERAKRLSERLKSKEDDEEAEESKSEVKRRPTERTKRTGATSRTEPEEMDPAKLAEAVPRSGF